MIGKHAGGGRTDCGGLDREGDPWRLAEKIRSLRLSHVEPQFPECGPDIHLPKALIELGELKFTNEVGIGWREPRRNLFENRAARMSARAFSQHPEMGMQLVRFGVCRDRKHVRGIVGFVAL